MTYTDAAISKVTRMAKAAIVRDIVKAGVCGSVSRWTDDELVTVWLDLYGERKD